MIIGDTYADPLILAYLVPSSAPKAPYLLTDFILISH